MIKLLTSLENMLYFHVIGSIFLIESLSKLTNRHSFKETTSLPIDLSLDSHTFEGYWNTLT